MKLFLSIANIAIMCEKKFFFHFPWQPLLAKQIPSSKLCSLSVKIMESKHWKNEVKQIKNAQEKLP